MTPAVTRIRAGWILDGSGAPARAGGILEISPECIVAVHPAGEETRAVDVDLGDCTLLPALVDAHVHLTMSGSADPGRRQRQLSPEKGTAFDTIRRHLRQHLAAGVTAVRDGGDHGGYVLAYKQRPNTGPVHLAAAGKAWHASGRYGRLIGQPPAGQGGLGAAIAAAPQRADHVKIVNSGLNSLKTFGRETAPQFTADEMRAAVAAANRLGLPVMVHANGRVPVGEAVAAGCASIEHGFFMGRANLVRMADMGTVWVPTSVTMAAYARMLEKGGRFGGVASGADLDVVHRNCDHQLEQLHQAREAGVTVAVGTDAGSLGVDHGTAVAEEMRLLSRAGYSTEAVVQAATRNGARLLGLTDRGRLQPGLRADIIAVKGPPSGLIDQLTHPAAVYIKGRRLSF